MSDRDSSLFFLATLILFILFLLSYWLRRRPGSAVDETGRGRHVELSGSHGARSMGEETAQGAAASATLNLAARHGAPPPAAASAEAPALRTQSVEPEAPAPAETRAASSAADDLEIIEGIGPKIAGLLRAEGITTFDQLAHTDVARLGEIMAANRLRHLADPATWPEQAALAAAGAWESLSTLQQTLKRGRRVS